MKHRFCRFSICASVCVTLLVGSSALLAHHGMAAIFDTQNKVTMTATLTKVDWVNPHIGLEFDVKGEDGRVESWKMETSPPRWFAKDGLTRPDFEEAIGKTVTVIFLKALDGSNYGYLERITFPNGTIGYSMNGAKDKDRK